MAVTSSVHFFNASLPGHYEKPYQLKFAGPDGFPTTNIATKDYDQKFVDIRGHEADYSVARHGFAIMRLEETMKHTDYDDDSRVQSIYLKQVADGLRAMLGASRVQIFEHVVSDPQPNRAHTTILILVSVSCGSDTQISQWPLVNPTISTSLQMWPILVPPLTESLPALH
jgi:hypothetical protein